MQSAGSGREMSATGRVSDIMQYRLLWWKLTCSSLGREDEMYDDRQDDRYGPSPGPDQPSGYLPPQQNAGFNYQQNYPGNMHFDPPPTAEAAYAPNPAYPQQQSAGYAPYNPAEWGAPGAAPQQYPYDASRGYGDSEANLGAPRAGETFAGDNRYPPAEPPIDDDRRRGRDTNNVSAPPPAASASVNDVSSERDAPDAGTSVSPLTSHQSNAYRG
jgi:hypothetical protein